MDMTRVFNEAFPLLLQGMWMTFRITIISLAIALVLGLVVSLMGMSSIKPLNWLAKFYLWLIRGTPLMVQGFFIYLAIPQLVQAIAFPDFRIPIVTASIITLSLNAGAYISEIFRGGIQAVDPGQMEAARSLGLSKSRAMMKVILPQALRISVPSLVNQVIITLKDTSILQTIGLAEVVYQAKIYIGTTMLAFSTWSVVALMYLVIITVLTWLTRYLEKRMDYAKKG